MIAPPLPQFVALHALGGAKDLPIPAALAIAGGTAALIVSFCVLALAWRTPRYDDHPRGTRAGGRLDVFDGPVFAWLLRVIGLVVTGYLVWALVAGPDLANNPTLGTFYVLVWVGLMPASLLFGRVVRAFSPIRTFSHLLALATGGDPARGVFRYPDRLGLWPAAVGLLAFTWQELVNPGAGMVSSVRLWLVVYAAVMLIGSALFGEEWLEHADPFEVYSDLVAHLSIWGRDEAGQLVVRSPLANLSTVVPRTGLVAVVAVLFGSTAFDSFKDSPTWVRVANDAGEHAQLLNSAALLGFCLVVGLTFVAASTSTAVGDRVRHRELPRMFAHSVVPIIVGYIVAHYINYLFEQGQMTIIQLSDPMVRGDNIVGTANWPVNYWLSFHPTLLSVLKVVAVVLGHITGVVAAHDRAIRLLPKRQHITGQLGMLVIMVCYTATGLYLLFGA